MDDSCPVGLNVPRQDVSRKDPKFAYNKTRQVEQWWKGNMQSNTKFLSHQIFFMRPLFTPHTFTAVFLFLFFLFFKSKYCLQVWLAKQHLYTGKSKSVKVKYFLSVVSESETLILYTFVTRTGKYFKLLWLSLLVIMAER